MAKTKRIFSYGQYISENPRRQPKIEHIFRENDYFSWQEILVGAIGFAISFTIAFTGMLAITHLFFK